MHIFLGQKTDPSAPPQVEILQAARAGSRRGAAAPRGGRGRDAEGAGAEGEAEPGGEGGWADGRMGGWGLGCVWGKIWKRMVIVFES